MIKIALLSDFHIKAKEDIIQKNTLEKYIDTFEEFVAKCDWIDLVIVSGDITKSGTREDFKKALIFFNRIKEALNLSPENFIFIPGNHDYNRNNTEISFKYIDKINLDRYNEIFNSKEFERHINKAFKNFNEFLRDFKGKILSLKGYCIDQNYIDINLHITVANSCLTNTIGNDKLQPYINIADIKKCLISKESKNLSIFLMHHPLSHLYIDNNRILNNLISESCDILISGHEHVPNYLQTQTVEGNEYISITNGCAFVDKDDVHEERSSRFCVLEYDPIRALVTLNPWFKTKFMNHFGRDTSLYSSAKDNGIIEFIIKSKGPQVVVDEEVDDPLEHIVIHEVLEEYFYRNFDKIKQANDNESIFKIKTDIKNKYKFNLNINRFVLSFLKYILNHKLIESFSDLKRLLTESFLFSRIKNIKKKILQFYNEKYFVKLNEDLSVKISKKHKKLRLDELKIKLSETEEKLKKYEESMSSIIETYKDRPLDHFPPLILDIEEIESEIFDWYKKINLFSNPFPSSDGLENIKEEMFEDIIYPTKIIQTFKEKITSNEISDLINKTICIYGAFGSGKTTLFQYIQKLLKQFHPKILTLTIPLEARASLDEIRRSFFLKLHSHLKQIHFDEIGYALKEKDLENDCHEMLRNLSINWRSLFIFIEDIYKHSSIGVFIEEILGFIKALQIYRKDLSVDSFKTSFYFSSIGEIVERIRRDHSVSGSVDMYTKMSPISLDMAFEMINKRLKAFSINPVEPTLITREFLSRLKTIAKQNGTPIITFRDYIDILLTRFRRLEFTEDSISIHSDDQILLTLKKDIESKHNKINKSFLELKQRSRNIEFFNGFLSILDELWSKNPIVEGDKRYFKSKAFLAHLHDVNLIKKIIVESRPAWTVSDYCREYFNKINNQYGLFPSSILPALYFTEDIIQTPDNKYLMALNNIIQRSEEYGAYFLNLLKEISNNYEDLDLLSSSYHILKDESISDSEIEKIRKSLEKMIIVLVLLCDSNTDNFDSAIIKYEKSWFEIPEITLFINDLNVYYEDPYPTIDQKALLLKSFLQIAKTFISKIKRLIQWDNIFKLKDRKIWKENKEKLNSIRKNLESDNIDFARGKILTLIKEVLKTIIFDYLRILYGEKKWIIGLPEENLRRVNKLKESDIKYELYDRKELHLNISIGNLFKIVNHISSNLIKGNNQYFTFIIEKGSKIMKAISNKNPWISEILDLIECSDSFFEKLFSEEIITPWTLNDDESIYGVTIKDNFIKKTPTDINYGFPFNLDKFLKPMIFSTKPLNLRTFVEIILTNRMKFKIIINYQEEKILVLKIPYV